MLEFLFCSFLYFLSLYWCFLFDERLFLFPLFFVHIFSTYLNIFKKLISRLRLMHPVSGLPSKVSVNEFVCVCMCIQGPSFLVSLHFFSFLRIGDFEYFGVVTLELSCPPSPRTCCYYLLWIVVCFIVAFLNCLQRLDSLLRVAIQFSFLLA